MNQPPTKNKIPCLSFSQANLRSKVHTSSTRHVHLKLTIHLSQSYLTSIYLQSHQITMGFYWAQSWFPFLLAADVIAGPAAYGICQAGCASIVMACYSAAGFTWGATMGASAPASIVACNSAFGTCQAACATVLLTPTL